MKHPYSHHKGRLLTHGVHFTAKVRPNFRYRLLATKLVLYGVLLEFIARQTESPTFVIAIALRTRRERSRRFASPYGFDCGLCPPLRMTYPRPTVHLMRSPEFATQTFRMLCIPIPITREGFSVNGCYLRIVMETRNFEHIEQIKNALKENGFRIVG